MQRSAATQHSRGTLGAGDDGYPYGVPISYAFDGSRIIIHSALAGHKVDAIAANPKVSLCIIDRDDVVPQEYTTYYRSVIVFGKARIIADEQEKRSALQAFAAKYTPDDERAACKKWRRPFIAYA